MQLEKSNPELSNSQRVNAAILHNADSDFVGKLNAWFDQTIDRVSEKFTAYARIITIAIAVVLALFLQLDTFDLINRLSTDDKLRETVISEAVQHPEKFNPSTSAEQKAAPPAKPATAGQPSVQDALTKALETPHLNQLADVKLIRLPECWQDWKERWFNSTAVSSCGAAPESTMVGQEQIDKLVPRIFGVLIAAALMSLGAPFWYELLKNLVRFRSLIQTKDDGQRQERQTTQQPAQPAAAAAPALPAALASGESGDLNAIG